MRRTPHSTSKPLWSASPWPRPQGVVGLVSGPQHLTPHRNGLGQGERAVREGSSPGNEAVGGRHPFLRSANPRDALTVQGQLQLRLHSAPKTPTARDGLEKRTQITVLKVERNSFIRRVQRRKTLGPGRGNQGCLPGSSSIFSKT